MRNICLILSASLVAFGQSTNTNLLTVIPKTDLSATGELRFRDSQATPHYVGFKAKTSIGSNIVWELPDSDAVGCWQSDGALHTSFTACGAAAILNGFKVTGSSSVMPPTTAMGWQAWYAVSDHSTNWLSYDNANALSPINIGSSVINLTGNPIISAVGAAFAPLTLQGAVGSNGNIVLQPGSVAGNASVSILTPRTDQPGLIINNTSGVTTGNVFEIRDSSSTVVMQVIGSGDTSAANALTLKGQVSPIGTTPTYSVGNSTHRWLKFWGQDMDLSGTITSTGTAPWVLKTGDTMSGALRFSTVGTIDVGQNTNPGGVAWFLTSLDSREVHLHGPSSADLTGGWTKIKSEIVVGPDRVDMLFQDTIGGNMLGLYRTVANVNVNQAIFDMHAFPLINSNGTTGYDVGGSSNLWRDIYWAGRLIQGSTTRLDASGNLTVNSCVGCGGVQNGFFMTGKTTVSPPSTATGVQMYFDPSPTFQATLKVYNNTAALAPLNISVSSFNLTDSPIRFGSTIGTLDVGSSTNPGGTAWFLNSLDTKQLNLHGTSASDLSSGWTKIKSEVVVGPDRVTMLFQDTAGANMLALDRTITGTNVNQAIFDLHVMPLINSNGATGYDLGGSSNQFRDAYFAGRLIQGGTTRLDASGNLTVTSCSGCGGVINGYFVTGKTTVSPPSTATGIQMYYDPSPTFQGFVKVYDGSNALAPLNVSASVMNLTNSPIRFGSTVGSLDVGTSSNPGGTAWFLTSMDTRQLNLHGPATSDLTGGWTKILSEVVAAPARVTMLFQDTIGGNMLALDRTITGTNVNQAIFDLHVLSLINSNGTTGYDVGGSSNQWRDIYWAGRLIQGGVTRLDASGNLTVNSCAGCGGAGVSNGFFVTGQSAVAPPSTAVGLQVYHDPSTHASFIKSYSTGSAVSALDITGAANFNQLTSFQGGISLGSTPTITNVGSGQALNIAGSATGNGNILLTPGNPGGGNNSVRVFQATNGQPAMILKGIGGATASTMLEIQDGSVTTARFWVEAGGNSTTSTGCPNCVHAATIFPASDGSFDLGADSLKWRLIKGYGMQLGQIPTDIPSGATAQIVQNGLSLFVIDGLSSGIASVVGRVANGTYASPTAITTGNQLFSIAGRGWNGSAYTTTGSAAVIVVANENWTPSAQGGDILFQTTTAGSLASSRTSRMSVTSAGLIPAADSTYALGSPSFRFASASIVSLTVGSCSGCGGGASLSANNTWTGINTFVPGVVSNGVFQSTGTGSTVTFNNSAGTFSVDGNGNVNLNGNLSVGGIPVITSARAAANLSGLAVNGSVTVNGVGNVNFDTTTTLRNETIISGGAIQSGLLFLNTGSGIVMALSGTYIQAPNGANGVSVSGSSCTVRTISAGIITSATCP